MGVQSLGQEDSLEEETAPTSAFLPGKSNAHKSLAGCSLWGCKNSDTTERLNTHTRVGETKNLNLDKLLQSGFCDVAQCQLRLVPTSLNL